VVDLIDGLPLDDRDTKGDLYEYMLAKIASAGQKGQFRISRAIRLRRTTRATQRRIASTSQSAVYRKARLREHRQGSVR
jgi:hypothetical protein